MREKQDPLAKAAVEAGQHPPPGSTELWKPPERLDANVGKMAWHLFLKTWDAKLQATGELIPCEEAATFYRHCIDVAKALDAINTGK